MYRVTTVRPLEGYRLAIEFEDGLRGEIDLTDRLFGPVFEPLRDPTVFRAVTVDEFDVICWPTGADLASHALHSTLAGWP